MNTIKIKALGLCSGGLDSILSAAILRNQGIDVQWICFETPFFSSDKAKKASCNLNIPLILKNITQIYIEMLQNPRCGYGKNMNPCMDCHALMFKLAGEYIKNNEFDFLFSGEVLGQRPMSQTSSSLRYVEKNSGFKGLILRPLSAKILPETIPEKKGWVNREFLFNISGRSRKPQIELAQHFGIKDYPSPAGGCLLTDPNYSKRLKDLFEHQNYYTENDFHLLKYGRHLRLNKNTKIIIGRTNDDNIGILAHYNHNKDAVIRIKNFPSPIVLIPNSADEDVLSFASAACIAYSKAPKDSLMEILIKTYRKKTIIKTIGFYPDKLKDIII